MANYQSQYTGPEIDAALGKAEDHEGRVQALESGFSGKLASLSGLSGAADKLPYLSGADTFALADLSAAGRLLLGGADAAAQRSTLGLGDAATQSVQSSDTDTTAGRLMPVGAFGLGANHGPLTDLQSVRRPGFYFAFTGATNAPDGSSANWSILDLGGFNPYNGVILAAKQNALSFNPLYIAAYSGGTLGSWYKLHHSGCIVGSVSQSGGVPTGAVIERGSNANGEYVRFADGTQMCWLTGTTTSANNTVQNFPAAFANSDYVLTITPNPGIAVIRSVEAHPSSNTTAVYNILDGSGARVDEEARLFVIGRWF